MDEVLSLEADVEVLHSMCLEAVEHVVTAERFRDFAIPECVWAAVAASWRRSDPHVYGRFDLRYDGGGPAKLLEYNADTPTTLLEASILQWHWLQDVFPDDDQWNSLHEKLVERWGEIRQRLPGDDVYFTWSRGDPTGEDHVTVGYLQETAAEAGLSTIGLSIEDVGWDVVPRALRRPRRAPHVDGLQALPVGVGAHRRLRQARAHVAARDAVAGAAVEGDRCSNKALLAVLWEMYPGHPNLLPAYLDEPGMLTEYVRKPRLGRRGREHRDRLAGVGDADRRRLRRGGLRLPTLRAAARVRRLPARAGRVDRR